jgi:hypothetical protein
MPLSSPITKQPTCPAPPPSPLTMTGRGPVKGSRWGGGDSSCSSNATCLGPTTPTILLRPAATPLLAFYQKCIAMGIWQNSFLSRLLAMSESKSPVSPQPHVTAPQRVRGSGSKPRSTGQGNRQANACRKERGRRRKAAWVPRQKLCLQPGSHRFFSLHFLLPPSRSNSYAKSTSSSSFSNSSNSRCRLGCGNTSCRHDSSCSNS